MCNEWITLGAVSLRKALTQALSQLIESGAGPQRGPDFLQECLCVVVEPPLKRGWHGVSHQVSPRDVREVSRRPDQIGVEGDQIASFDDSVGRLLKPWVGPGTGRQQPAFDVLTP